jgi:hypothetical protein
MARTSKTKDAKKARDTDKAITMKTNGAGAGTGSFWQLHRRLFLGAWRRLWQWRTLLHVALDLALILFVLVLVAVNSLIFSTLSQPLVPVLQAIGQLEASGTTAAPVSNADRMALLEQYQPDINGVLLRAGLISLGLFLVFIIFYGLAKTRIWMSLQGEGYSWWLLRRNLVLSLAWFVVVAAIPVGLLFLSPVASAYVLACLVLLTILAFPLLYATSSGGWKTFLHRLFWRPFGNYLFVCLIGLLLWVLVANLLGFAMYVSQDVYVVLLALWMFVFAAWGRYYVDNFVNEFFNKREKIRNEG